MPTVNFSNLAQNFIYSNSGSADFASYVTHSATFYTLLTTGGHAITVQGSGITVDGSNIPTAGTITSVNIDLGNNLAGTPGITITGLDNIDLTTFDFTAGAASNNTFWANVLAGVTDIIPGAGPSSFRIGGDFAGIESGVNIGADENATGADVDNNFFFGDAQNVTGGTLIGGDDMVTGVFDIAVGDTDSLSGSARVFGGNDTIVFTQDYTGDSNVTVLGDVAVVADDTIFGTVNNDFLDGDVNFVDAGAVLNGGDDIIFGGGGNDSIFGDYSSNGGGPDGTGGPSPYTLSPDFYI